MRDSALRSHVSRAPFIALRRAPAAANALTYTPRLSSDAQDPRRAGRDLPSPAAPTSASPPPPLAAT